MKKIPAETPGDKFISGYKNKLNNVPVYDDSKNKKSKKLSKTFFKKFKIPESLSNWGVLYFGDRGSGKTLHQANEIQKVFDYWKILYTKYPKLYHGIVLTNQTLSEEAIKGNEEWYYHFDDLSDTRFCPRKNCWRGKKKHQLHGALIVLDDISTVLPPDSWQQTPQWLRKQWTQAQHFGLHFLFNCQDPTAYDINARRATQLCFKFRKVIGNRRPDETAKPVPFIWGIYARYKIKASWLWQFGDMDVSQITQFKEALKAKKEMTGKSLFKGIWKMSLHLITKKKTSLYDTLEDVKEYEPRGYIGKKQFECIDPTHNHTDKDLPNYSSFKKNEHELV